MVDGVDVMRRVYEGFDRSRRGHRHYPVHKVIRAGAGAEPTRLVVPTDPDPLLRTSACTATWVHPR